MLLVALTEKRTPADIDRLAEVLAEVLRERVAVKLIYEKSQAGRRACSLPDYELPTARGSGRAARAPIRRACPSWPSPTSSATSPSSSTRNFGVDTGFYPLGSCTMKYNPRVNERLAALPGFRDLHPLPGAEDARRERSSSCGGCRRSSPRSPACDAVSLQPAAGSQGELTGLMLVRA